MNQTSSSVQTPLVEIVQSLYAAFGRGDIPSLLAGVSSEVDWGINVDPSAPGAKRIPDFRRFRGRDGVRAFFSIIDAELEFHSFVPVSFLSGGNEVVARVQMDLTVKSTGRRMSSESMHLFVFDEARQLIRFTEYMDTLASASAWDVIEAKP